MRTLNYLKNGGIGAHMRMSMQSTVNQPRNREGVRITVQTNDERLTFDLSHADFTLALGGNYAVPVHAEVIELKLPTPEC